MTKEELQEKNNKVNRIEVINHADNRLQIGRIVTLHQALGEFNHIEMQYQDNGKTLKIFIS